MDKEKGRRILLVNPFGIGDVIFTTPIIGSIRSAFPNSYIGYLCNERTSPVLFSDPRIDMVFVFERDEYRRLWRLSKAGCVAQAWHFFRRIRRECFDTVLDFSMDREYSFISMLAGIRRRIGYNYKNRGIFLTDKADIPRGYSGMHVIDHHKGLLRLLSEDMPDQTVPRIYVTRDDIEKAKHLLKAYGMDLTDKYICVMPGAGASWGSTAFRRRWPVARFAEAVSRLRHEFPLKVVLLGSLDERRLCDYISGIEPGLVNLCGKCSLMESVAVLKHAQALLTNDGGPLHMAVAVGTKTVSIFGPVPEDVYGPYPVCEKYVIIRDKLLSCSPCYKNFSLPECDELKCLNNINVDMVVQAMRSLLS
ncbi:MAG: glycosyltransferase family 9 protein [Candidatus Omnitrophota bacterium]